MPSDEATSQEQTPLKNPYHSLMEIAPSMIAHGVVVSIFQFFIRRAIYAQTSKNMLDAYGLYSTIEGLLYILLFKPFRIFSLMASDYHKKEEEKNSLFDPTQMGLLYRQGILSGMILLIPSLLLCLCAPTLFRWTNQPEYVIENTRSYYAWLLSGLTIDMFFRLRARIDAGRSHPEFLLMGDICESTLLAAGTYVLVDGKYGFPNLGVSSSTAAYTLGASVTTVIYSAWSYFTPGLEKYQFFAFKLSEFKTMFFSKEFWSLFWDGLYYAIKDTIIYLNYSITTFLCSTFGVAPVIGLQAADTYSNLLRSITSGFFESSSIVMKGMIQKSFKKTKDMGNFSINTSALFTTFCAGILYVFRNSYTRIFITDKAANQADFDIAKNFVCIQLIREIINSVSDAGAGILSACNELTTPLKLSGYFILGLNSLLAIASYYLFPNDSISLYEIQLVGLILNAIGILFCWTSQEASKTIENTIIPSQISDAATYAITIFPAPESPRRSDPNELLPTLENLPKK